MSECKKTCGNCAGLIRSVLSKDRCDMTNKPIEDYSFTCDNWEPTLELKSTMYENELKAWRKERDELKTQVKEREREIEQIEVKCCACHAEHIAQVAVLRGAMEEVRKGHIESRFDHEDGASIEVFARDVHIVIDQALEQTPEYASDRVQKIVMTLEKIRDAKCISERPGTYYKILASEALAEWNKP